MEKLNYKNKLYNLHFVIFNKTFSLFFDNPGSLEICAYKYISATPLLHTLLHIS